MIRNLHLVSCLTFCFILFSSLPSVVVVFAESSLTPPTLKTLKTADREKTTVLEAAVASTPSASEKTIAEIHGSFGDEINPKLTVDPSVLTQINAELKETVEDIVLTLAGSAVGSEVAANASDDRYVVRAEPRVPGQPPPEETPDVELENTTDVTPPPRTPPEDIPSFSEWTQKQLAERRLADPNVTERVRSTKHRIKNYASPDCGAKIVAANPEAVSAAAVLSSSRDEYMLNHCTARIWFIVELCEAVQAKQIDLANFELFSSSPKEFSVYLGSRFPSRDWRLVGRFTALDSRDIQTFDLNPFLFGKYLKVEVHSHYGKEHYCPLSWVRVYGTSEYEVLATEDERHDDDDDVAEEEAGDVPRNLFSSATDAVLSIVKKATAPFLKTEERLDPTRVAPSLCVSPRYLVVCDNCSQHMDDNLFYILSCRHDFLYEMVALPFIRRTLILTDTCLRYGLDFVTLREGAPYPKMYRQETENYLTALLKEPYVAALCNALAVIENRVVVNTSMATPTPVNQTENNVYLPPPISIQPPSSTCVAPDYSTSTATTPSKDFSQTIQPTKTLKEHEMKHLQMPKEDSLAIEHTEATSVPAKVNPTVNVNIVSSSSEQSSLVEDEVTSKVSFVAKEEEEEKERETDSTLDAILQDLSDLEQAVNSQPASATPPPSPPKDSIFLRLANRIKNLELNMSLSSSYLEEMSRRYRLQLESLGQTVNSTSMRIEEQARLDELRSRRREEEMAALRAQLSKLTQDVAVLLQERNSWLPRPIHIFWFIMELLVVWYIAVRWGGLVPSSQKEYCNSRSPNHRKPTRRNSVGAAPGHVCPSRPIERRPSDEALEIALAINYSMADRKRKKKKKEGSRKSSTVGMKSQKSNSSDESAKDGLSSIRQTSEPPIPTQSLINTPVMLPLDITTTNRFAAFGSPEQVSSVPVPANRLVRRFSSPTFMRTAMSSRATRPVPSDPVARPKKESGIKKYMRKFF